VFQKAENFGTALHKYTEINDEEYNFRFVLFYSNNNVQYHISDLACGIYNFIPIPIYSQLGDEGNNHIFKSTKVTVALIASNKLKKFV